MLANLHMVSVLTPQYRYYVYSVLSLRQTLDILSYGFYLLFFCMAIDQVDQRTADDGTLHVARDSGDMFRSRRAKATRERKMLVFCKASHALDEVLQVGCQLIARAGDATERDAVDKA